MSHHMRHIFCEVTQRRDDEHSRTHRRLIQFNISCSKTHFLSDSQIQGVFSFVFAFSGRALLVKREMEGPGYYYQVKYIVPYYCLIERLLRDSGCFCSSSRSLRVLILTCCGWYFSSGSILALYAAISPAVLFLEPNLRILGYFSLFSSRIINYITAISLLIQCSMF